MRKPTTVAELLTEQRDYMRDHGWVQGRLHGFHGEVCLIGAEMSVSIVKYHFNVHYIRREAIRIVTEVIQEQYPERANGVTVRATFNDHKDTTLADVMAVWEKAIARASA